MNIGIRIKSIRRGMGIGKRELARRIGSNSQLYIKKIEENEIEFDEVLLDKIAEAFSLSKEELLGEVDLDKSKIEEYEEEILKEIKRLSNPIIAFLQENRRYISICISIKEVRICKNELILNEEGDVENE